MMKKTKQNKKQTSKQKFQCLECGVALDIKISGIELRVQKLVYIYD